MKIRVILCGLLLTASGLSVGAGEKFTMKASPEISFAPAHLTVRTVEGPGNQMSGVNSGYASLPRDGRSSTRSGHGDLDEASGPSDALYSG